MNLQTTFTQANPFPFPFGFINSRAEELLKSSGENKSRPNSPRLENKPVLSREAIIVISEHGKNRFNEFKNYQNGWYGGKGRKISIGSVFVFEQFIKYLPKLKRVTPSLFFTLEGNLQLGFEDKHGNKVEIEFFPDKVEYYMESSEEESFVKLADLTQLVKKLESLLN